jgi:hypothetical protein
MAAAADFERSGWSVHTNVLPAALREDLLAVFASIANDRAGSRAGLEHAAVQALAKSPNVRAIVAPILGEAAFCFRATLFDKHDAANWLVAWHQDRVVPVRERIDDAPGYANWSQKPGDGTFVEPPAAVLAELLAIRVDLDGSALANGGLRVIAGSHHDVVLSRVRIDDIVATATPAQPEVPPSGALRLRPLLLHASSRSLAGGHRRIVHLEFAAEELPDPVRYRARVS